MRAITGLAVIVIALATGTAADAKGCIKGAIVGGAAGHYAGHHGVLGAAAGCIIGRHEANKRARLQRREDRDNRANQDHGRSPNEQRL